MPTPTKPTIVLMHENKSHRTKAELKQRQEAEKALETGCSLKESKEVKENKIAHREFKRIEKLLLNIQKNDALFENIINRYCVIYAECIDFEQKRESFNNDLTELIQDKDKFEDVDQITEYFKLKSSMQKNILDIDKQIQTKRRMLLDIEKENIMTIASALRSIPKKVDEKESDPLLKVLQGARSG